MISYEPFWITLKKKNISTYALVEKHHVSPSTLQRLRNNENLQASTLDGLCQALECRIEDVIEILPDGTEILVENQSIKRNCSTIKRLEAYSKICNKTYDK